MMGWWNTIQQMPPNILDFLFSIFLPPSLLPSLSVSFFLSYCLHFINISTSSDSSMGLHSTKTVQFFVSAIQAGGIFEMIPLTLNDSEGLFGTSSLWSQSHGVFRETSNGELISSRLLFAAFGAN